LRQKLHITHSNSLMSPNLSFKTTVAWECFSPYLVGWTMPIGREMVATVVLMLDIILNLGDEGEL
jgi:hypothetical protein